jgi:hypothetical protein
VESSQTPTTTFLRAEEAATRLAEELGRLDEESRRYDQATTSLTSASSQLQALADAVRSSGEDTAAVVDAIRQVSAPDLVSGVERIGASASEALTKLGTVRTSIDGIAGEMTATRTAVTALSGMPAALDVLSGIPASLDALSGAPAALDAISRQGIEAIDAVRAQATAASKQISELQTVLTRSLDEASARHAKQQRLILFIAGAAAFLSAASLVMQFTR